MNWNKKITNITSGALLHHLIRPGTGVCMFGLVGDVQSVVRCESTPVATAWLWCNDTRHSCGSLVNQPQTSSSSGRVTHGLLPPNFASPTLHTSVLHYTENYVIYANCFGVECIHVILKCLSITRLNEYNLTVHTMSSNLTQLESLTIQLQLWSFLCIIFLNKHYNTQCNIATYDMSNSTNNTKSSTAVEKLRIAPYSYQKSSYL